MGENQRGRWAAKLALYENQIILGMGIVLAVWLRLSLSPLQTLDFTDFTGRWFDFIQANGGFRALQYDFANYAPPYLYLLVISSAVFAGLPDVLAIKVVAMAFDFVAADMAFRLVRLRYPAGSGPHFAFLAVLFAPTVFLNSSFWGQADVVYTAVLLAMLYCLLTGRERAGFIACGLALSIKLQALFLAPLLAILWLRGRVSWRSFLWIPAVYLVSIVPAWLAGRPLAELLLIYREQAGVYTALTMNAANLYQWLPNDQYDLLYPAGLAWSLAAALIFVAGVYKSGIRLTLG